MDKKFIPTRKIGGPARRLNQPAGGLIALGARPGTPESKLGGDRGGPPKKVPRIEVPGPSSSVGPPSQTSIQSQSSRKEPTDDSIWLPLATVSDISPTVLVQKVKSAEERLKTSRIPKYLCSVVKKLGDSRGEIDPAFATSLTYLVRRNAAFFQEKPVIEAFSSLLKRCPPGAVRKSNRTQTIVCNVLMAAFSTSSQWPPTFFKVYIDDSLGDRAWVDAAETESFVKNILTAIKTKPIRPELLSELNLTAGNSDGSAERITGSGSNPSEQSPNRTTVPTFEESITENPLVVTLEEDDCQDTSLLRLIEGDEDMEGVQATYEDRFTTEGAEEGKEFCMSILQDWWSKRLEGVPKSLLKTMTACCGLAEVRLAAVQRLDTWLQNAKLQRSAMELFVTVCTNCPTVASQQIDVDILQSIIRLRAIKSRPVTAAYCLGVRELLTGESLGVIMKLVIHNELSSSRTANNMLILQQCFRHNPKTAVQVLASIMAEFMEQMEDISKSLRTFMRELCRNALKGDFPLLAFGKSFLAECNTKHKERFADVKQGFVKREEKERILRSVVEFVAFTGFVGINPGIKEAAQIKKDMTVVRQYQREVSEFEAECLTWLYDSAFVTYTPQRDVYIRCLYACLYAEKLETYTAKDNWPSESERSLFFRILADSPIEETILLRILLMGLDQKFSLDLKHSVDLMELLVNRAANAASKDNPTLKVTKVELIDLLFNSCSYRPPPNIELPTGYMTPMLAVVGLYWKACVTLVMMAAYNPDVIGRLVWDSYPTLRYMMEMLIIGDFSWPPFTAVRSGTTLESIRAGDVQETELDRHKILDMESHLAAASTKQVITESTSHLLGKLISLNPRGPARRPPQNVLDELEALNANCSFGILLCGSRKPDFLLEIINGQGSNNSLPWLIRLMEKNVDSLTLLPIQCICEFFLHQISTEGHDDQDTGGEMDWLWECGDGSQTIPTTSSSSSSSSTSRKSVGSSKATAAADIVKSSKSAEFKTRLRSAVWGASESEQTTIEETLTYFLRRLHGNSYKERSVTLTALHKLLSSEEDVKKSCGHVDPAEILSRLEKVPCFTHIREKVCEILRKCLMVETDAAVIVAYLDFLMEKSGLESKEALAKDLAEFLVKRARIVEVAFPSEKEWSRTASHVYVQLLEFYLARVTEAQDSQDHSPGIEDDLMMIKWDSKSGKKTAILSRNFVSSNLLLLSFLTPSALDETKEPTFSKLLQIWFPRKKESISVSTLSAEEKTAYIQDWLCVKLLQRTIHSEIADWIVDGIRHENLSIFIQAFGIPVDQINKVLGRADQLIKLEPETSSWEANSDSTMLKMLREYTEAHHLRGANKGFEFLKWCHLKEPGRSAEKEEKMETSNDEKSEVSVKPPPRKRLAWMDQLANLADQDSKLKDVLKAGALNRYGEQLPAPLRKLNKEAKSGVSKLETPPRARGAISNSDSVLTPSTLSIHKRTKLKEVLLKLKTASTQKETQRLMDEWLFLDPDVIGVSPTEELGAIFGRGSMSSPVQRHLLNILCHQTRISVVKTTVRRLLEKYSDSFDETSVLDFVWVSIHLPRIWQGRDRNLPRNHKKEDILCLDKTQLENLVEFVVQEGARKPLLIPVGEEKKCARVTGKFERTFEWSPIGLESQTMNLAGSSYREPTMSQRTKLLLWAAAGDPSKLRIVLQKSLALSDHQINTTASTASFLLSELYFSEPEFVSSWIPPEKFDSVLTVIRTAVHTDFSKADSMSYRLISDLVQQAQSSQSTKRMEKITAILLKLAKSHPSLLIRQLPLLAGAMRGKTSFTMRQLQASNHRLFLHVILSFLEALIPTVFDTHYRNALHDILRSFFDFIQKYAIRNLTFLDTVDRVMKLIQGLYQHSSDTTAQFLKEFTPLLQTLCQRYPRLTHGKSLITLLSLPFAPSHAQSEKETGNTTGPKESGDLRPVHNAPMPVINIAQASPLLNRLIYATRSEGELTSSSELLRILKELDECSYSNPTWLTFFLEALEGLMDHPHTPSRGLVFSLILRHLYMAPHNSDAFLIGYLNCLNHFDSEIAGTAIEFLESFAPVFQEKADVILDACLENARRGMLNENRRKIITDAVSIFHTSLPVVS